MQLAKPELKAILTCDTIIADKATDKYSLIGIFDRIYIARFPAAHFPSCLYVAFTEASGDYKMRLEFYDLTEGKVIGSASLPNPIHCPDRFRIHQVVFRLPPVPLPHEGSYEMRVYANDQILGQKTIQAIQRG